MNTRRRCDRCHKEILAYMDILIEGGLSRYAYKVCLGCFKAVKAAIDAALAEYDTKAIILDEKAPDGALVQVVHPIIEEVRPSTWERICRALAAWIDGV